MNLNRQWEFPIWNTVLYIAYMLSMCKAVSLAMNTINVGRMYILPYGPTLPALCLGTSVLRQKLTKKLHTVFA